MANNYHSNLNLHFHSVADNTNLETDGLEAKTMNALTLTQNKRLILAGLLAFIILLASQISVRAYEFIGNVRTVYTIGTASGYPVLTIGSAGSGNSALNIGASPTVTGAAALDNSSTATLSATVGSMGVVSDANLGFNYGLTTAYGSNATEQVISSPGTYTQNVELSTNLHIRPYVLVDEGLIVYGDDVELNRLDKYRGVSPIVGIVPVLVLLGILIGGGVTGFRAWSYGRNGDTQQMQVWGFLTIALIGISIVIFPLIVEALTNILNGRW